MPTFRDGSADRSQRWRAGSGRSSAFRPNRARLAGNRSGNRRCDHGFGGDKVLVAETAVHIKGGGIDRLLRKDDEKIYVRYKEKNSVKNQCTGRASIFHYFVSSLHCSFLSSATSFDGCLALQPSCFPSL